MNKRTLELTHDSLTYKESLNNYLYVAPLRSLVDVERLLDRNFTQARRVLIDSLRVEGHEI